MSVTLPPGHAGAVAVSSSHAQSAHDEVQANKGSSADEGQKDDEAATVKSAQAEPELTRQPASTSASNFERLADEGEMNDAATPSAQRDATDGLSTIGDAQDERKANEIVPALSAAAAVCDASIGEANSSGCASELASASNLTVALVEGMNDASSATTTDRESMRGDITAALEYARPTIERLSKTSASLSLSPRKDVRVALRAFISVCETLRLEDSLEAGGNTAAGILEHELEELVACAARALVAAASLFTSDNGGAASPPPLRRQACESVYEYQGKASKETVFRLQSVMTDVQALARQICEPNDKLEQLVLEYHSTRDRLRAVHARLHECARFYNLPVSCEGSTSAATQSDDDALRRTFARRVALTGSLYLRYLDADADAKPLPPSERRARFSAWCIDQNAALAGVSSGSMRIVSAQHSARDLPWRRAASEPATAVTSTPPPRSPTSKHNQPQIILSTPNGTAVEAAAAPEALTPSPSRPPTFLAIRRGIYDEDDHVADSSLDRIIITDDDMLPTADISEEHDVTARPSTPQPPASPSSVSSCFEPDTPTSSRADDTFDSGVIDPDVSVDMSDTPDLVHDTSVHDTSASSPSSDWSAGPHTPITPAVTALDDSPTPARTKPLPPAVVGLGIVSEITDEPIATSEAPLVVQVEPDLEPAAEKEHPVAHKMPSMPTLTVAPAEPNSPPAALRRSVSYAELDKLQPHSAPADSSNDPRLRRSRSGGFGTLKRSLSRVFQPGSRQSGRIATPTAGKLDSAQPRPKLRKWWSFLR